LVFKTTLSEADPRKARHHRQPDLFIVNMKRHGYPNRSLRWVYGQMEVLDVFSDDLHADARHR
jgi:hypothetical protein